MATPLAFRPRTVVINCSISSLPREEVGSSMMISLASSDTALAISTICCWPVPSLPHSILTSISGWPRVVSACLASSYILG